MLLGHVSVQRVDQKPGFLVLHKQSNIACKCFSVAGEVFLSEKPGFLPPVNAYLVISVYNQSINKGWGKLKTLFQTGHDVLILTGSSTGGMEAAVVNTLSPGDRVLAASVGRFGYRWADIAQAFGTDVTRLRFPDGQAADPAAIEKALAGGAPFKALLLTHIELRGKTLGLVGLGRIGSAVARQVVDVLAGRAPRHPVNVPLRSPE